MTICVVCQKSSSKHTKKLWQLHKVQLIGNCIFCKKPKREHSKDLLQIHESSVERIAGSRKLYSIHTYGRIQPYPALLEGTYIWKNAVIQDLIPIYMSCNLCTKYLGTIEEDFADLLDGLCFVCFKDLTGQTEVY